MESAAASVLVVEDDSQLAAILHRGLTEEGFQVTRAASAPEAQACLLAQSFELVLLDLGLPGGDGLEILAELRSRNDTRPVLVLTARGDVEDRVQGLQIGADDYLPKPFAFEELLARVRALLRRARHSDPLLISRDLHIDQRSRTVQVKDQPLELTPREYDLLAHLVRHESDCVSRETLAREVWRVRSRATPLDNLIDVSISRLRGKLTGALGQNPIETIRGLGYRFHWPA